ncbi:MAG: hypothetical protein Q8L21_01020, partial [Candidatus Komeilibacteria bacterium]|nr:hypothetical protein [Candidatus Komeilibacteria bacterium]
QSRAAFSPEQLKKITPRFKGQITIDNNPQHALKSTLKKLKPQDALVITGSFYLAGEARKHWMSEEKILTKRTTN